MLNIHRNSLNYLYFCLLACFWGASYVGIKITVLNFPPFFSAALRVSIALAFLFILFRILKRPTSVPFETRWKLWVVGLFAQSFPFAFLFWGERYISAGLAGVLNGTVPIWTFLISLLIGRQYDLLVARKVIGLLLGITGVFIIFAPVLSFKASPHSLLGSIAVLMMALSYAMGAFLTQQLFTRSAGVNFQANIYHQHIASASFLILISLLFEHWPSWHVFIHATSALLASVYLGVVSTAIAFLMYYHLIREWGVVRASSVTYIAPIIALFWDFVFFRNEPGLFEGIGITAILCGVVLIQLTKKT